MSIVEGAVVCSGVEIDTMTMLCLVLMKPTQQKAIPLSANVHPREHLAYK